MKVVNSKMRAAALIEANREVCNAMVAFAESVREPIRPALLEACEGDEERARTAEVLAVRRILSEHFRDVEVLLGSVGPTSINKPERAALAAARRFLQECPVIDPEQGSRSLCAPAVHFVELAHTSAMLLRDSTKAAYAAANKKKGGMVFFQQSA